MNLYNYTSGMWFQPLKSRKFGNQNWFKVIVEIYMFEKKVEKYPFQVQAGLQDSLRKLYKY